MQRMLRNCCTNYAQSSFIITHQDGNYVAEARASAQFGIDDAMGCIIVSGSGPNAFIDRDWDRGTRQTRLGHCTHLLTSLQLSFSLSLLECVLPIGKCDYVCTSCARMRDKYYTIEAAEAQLKNTPGAICLRTPRERRSRARCIYSKANEMRWLSLFVRAGDFWNEKSFVELRVSVCVYIVACESDYTCAFKLEVEMKGGKQQQQQQQEQKEQSNNTGRKKTEPI